jgi:hypothetical protein
MQGQPLELDDDTADSYLVFAASGLPLPKKTNASSRGTDFISSYLKTALEA